MSERNEFLQRKLRILVALTAASARRRASWRSPTPNPRSAKSSPWSPAKAAWANPPSPPCWPWPWPDRANGWAFWMPTLPAPPCPRPRRGAVPGRQPGRAVPGADPDGHSGHVHQFAAGQQHRPGGLARPVIAGAVKQFWTDVIWEDVDYLFVDMPPGTGDVPLTVFQSLPVDGVVIVTSPQDLVSMIVTKAVKMANMMHIPVLGFVENYAYLTCPDCGKKISVFGESKLDQVAKEVRPAHSGPPAH